MLPIKNILYPVDFSARSRDVWPAVAGMARNLGVPVTLLHAIYAGDETEQLVSALEPARHRAELQLATYLTGESERLDARSQATVGNPADVIVGTAKEMQDPMIMMPTRGHSRFRQLLLGSVTAAVLHDADCPVWTEAHAEGTPEHQTAFRSIVCAIDMGARTPDVLTAARTFQSQLGTTLHVVHSVPGIDPRFPSGLADRAHELLMANARESFPVHCRDAGIQADLEIAQDPDLVEGVVKAAVAHSADLLVIGRGVIQGTLGRLRTNAHELIRRSPCPVISV